MSRIPNEGLKPDVGVRPIGGHVQV